MESVDNNKYFTQHHLETQQQRLWITEVFNNKSTGKNPSEQGLYNNNHIPTYLLTLLNN